MAKARARLLVSGMVQGVFFRAFTQDVARSHGLTGWVRNTPSGDVEAVFEGERKSVEEAIDLCRQGPPASHVTAVKVHWEACTGEFASFSIRYS